MALERARCVNHPDRYGHAVCMTCKKTVCQECATDWDGIFYCAPCLGKRRKAGRKAPPVVGWVLVTAACAALFVIAPPLLVWGATLILRSF